MADLVLIEKTDLTSVADKIREKVGSSDEIRFPYGFAEELNKIMSCQPIIDRSVKSIINENIQQIKSGAFKDCTQLTYINLPSVTKLYSGCFDNTGIKEANFPLVTTGIVDTVNQTSIFSNCAKLETINFPSLISSSSNMFEYCQNLKNVNLPVLKTLKGGEFLQCTSLETISLPMLESAETGNFEYCSALKTISMPNLTKMGNNMFRYCTSLQSIITDMFPKVTTISDNCFEYCSGLKTIDLPNVTTLGIDCFYGCTALTSVNLPNVVSGSGYRWFGHCTSLETINLPMLTTTSSVETFTGCTSLHTVDFASVQTINTTTFYNCSSLQNVILRSNTLCTLSDKNAFYGTPFYTGGTGGIVYVPAALVESYQTATNWSSLTCKFIPIEGELQAFKGETMLRNNEYQANVTYYCPMDNKSEPTVTVLSNNTDIVSVSDIVISDKNIAFNVNSHNIDGEATITVTVVFDDRVFTQSSSFRVVEVLPYEYSVESVDGATYGFSLNDAGYYESQNKGEDNSYAICKVNFTTDGSHSMKLKCINSGESNYDYGILSNVDTTLTLSYTVDSANVFKSFKGLSSTTEQIVDYGVVEEGEHFIYIKYRKDNSGKSGNDSLQFSVEFVE